LTTVCSCRENVSLIRDSLRRMLLALVCGEEPDGNDDDDEGVEEP
jgi:hypothetical protein